jgi:hypothetical protein
MTQGPIGPVKVKKELTFQYLTTYSTWVIHAVQKLNNKIDHGSTVLHFLVPSRDQFS